MLKIPVNVNTASSALLTHCKLKILDVFQHIPSIIISIPDGLFKMMEFAELEY